MHVSSLDGASVYLRTSVSGNEGLLKHAQLCDAPGARKKFMRDLNIHPQCTLHCSPLCPCSHACVKGGHKLQAVFMQMGAVPLPRMQFAASVAADAFLFAGPRAND